MTRHPGNLAEGYAGQLERLSPDRIGDLVKRCTSDVHFADPFNDVRGRDAMAHVFRDMFEKLDEVSFETQEVFGSDERWVLRYVFTASSRTIGRVSIPGLSLLRFDTAGLVREHLDYWDGGAIYERIPLLGRAVRTVKRRLSA